jgi:ABC-type phosphate transport system substrate-binding protein
MSTRLGRLGALVALCACIVMVAFAADASATGTPCSNIKGSGSSLQNIAQNDVWIPYFTTEGGWKESVGSEEPCEAEPTIEYKATSSGTGEAEWGSTSGALGSEKAFPAFIGTDVAPEGPATTEGTQMFEMDKAGQKEAGKPNAVVAVPVAQSAIAIVISLPVGCTPASTSEEPEINSKKLEEEWFSDKILFKNLFVEKPTGANCEVSPVLRAREKASGTTAGFKRYLNKVGKELSPENKGWETFVSTPAKAENTEWPSGTNADETKDPTGGALAENVYNEPGKVGYVDLSDAVAKGFTAKPVKHKNSSEQEYYSFFAKVQDNKAEESPAWKSPSTKPSEPTKGGSNCEHAKYEEPSEVGPNVDWSKAEQNNGAKGETYSICTLTFDVSWQHYEYGNLKTKYSESFVEGGKTFNTSATAVLHPWFLLLLLLFVDSTILIPKLEEHQYAAPPSAAKTKAETGVKKSGNIGL